ncbi:MAG TPA: type III pantothenate kinase [Cyclobacteriaceae bacterium]
MNLIVDIGNTRIKAAVFNESILVEKHTFLEVGRFKEFLKDKAYDRSMISSVRSDDREIVAHIPSPKIQLTSSLDLPIKVNYDTPKTLGVDRIAAACGAFELFPGSDCLVIDMGTCITYDFLSSKGVFEGGAIAPGVKMRFAAMNHFTSRLPLVDPVADAMLTGKSTATSMQSGVINGILEEIKGFISRYQSHYPGLKTVACGGDLVFFENSIKPSIFAAPELVLTGLNRILLHHING